MSRGICVTMLAVFVAVMGCEQPPADRTPGAVTSEDVRRDAGQAINTAVEYSQQAQDEFQQSFAVQFEKMETEIARLREQGRDLKDEAKADWDQKLADLEVKREAARAKLAEVGRSSAEAWKDVQSRARSAWEDLDQAVADASREF